MRTQVRIHIDDDLLPCYEDWSPAFHRQINTELIAKISAPMLPMPVVPRIGERLNLLSFEAHFGLSAREKEYLADCNYLLEICEVVICEEFVEVYGRRVE